MSSSSKEVNSNEPSRQPKCTRCRHHGLVVPQKGHSKRCPYLQCSCWKCLLITERTRINTLQRRFLREEEQSPETRPTAAAGQEDQATTATSPDGGARQPAPGGVVCPRPVRVTAPWVPGPAAEGPITEIRDQSTSPDNSPSFWRDHGYPPLPVLHVPVWRPAPYPHRSNFLVNMPWSPVPPGLYEGNLSPLIVPPLPPGSMYPPSPSPEPGPSGDPRHVFVTLRPPPPPPPEFHHQEALSGPPPTHPFKFPDEDSENNN